MFRKQCSKLSSEGLSSLPKGLQSYCSAEHLSLIAILRPSCLSMSYSLCSMLHSAQAWRAALSAPSLATIL